MGSATRAEYAPGIDLTPEPERDHGALDVDPTTLTEGEFTERIRTASRAERMQLLFGFEPFDYQRDLIAHTEADTVRVAVRPGRQVGKTLTGAALAADEVATTPGEDVLIAAPFQETADEMMREAKRFLREADRRLEAVGESLGVPSENRNKREWEFDHGGRLLSRTLGVDGVGQRGKSPQFVIVDEAAYATDAIFEDVIEPFFITHDEYTFILTSTPAGDSGYFYEKVELDDDWHSPYWPTALSPLVDPEWLAERERKNDRRTFRREYLGEFPPSSDRFFPPSLVDDVTRDGATTGRRGVVLGADIARAGDDRTVIMAADNTTAEVLVSDRDMTLSAAAGHLRNLYDDRDAVGVLVDETGLGAGVVEMLQEEIGSRAVEGVKFTLDRKQSLYNGLKTDLERGDLTIAHHPHLVREMKKLNYSTTSGGKTKIQAPDNAHDDHPDALALVAEGRREHHVGGGDILAFSI